MFWKHLVIIQIFVVAVFFGNMAAAAPFTFNVDGVISDNAGAPLESSNVTFTIDVKNTAETCTLYRESFSVNMMGSSGYFSLVLGKQSNAISGGTSLDKVFSNIITSIPGQSCTYTPASATDTRKIIVSFTDGATTEVFSAQEIQSVPYALEAGQSGKFTGALSGDVTGSQTATAVAKIQGKPVDLTGIADGKILKYQSGSFIVADDLNGTTAITALTGDVTAAGAGTVSATIGANKITTSHILDGTILGADLNFTGSNASGTGVVLQDASGKFVNLTCSTAGYVLTWTVTGWGCVAQASAGITSLNGLSATAQTFATSTAGATLGFTSATSTHTLNIPMANSAGTTAGLISNTEYASFNGRLPLIGGTMSGAIDMNSNTISNVGNLSMASNKYFTLSSTATNGTTAGQMWYDAGVIKYYDGSGVKSLSALSFVPVNKSGDTMSGDLLTQNISMSTGKYFKLSSNSTDGTLAGQVWYDSGIIKYYDGTTVRSLGVAGAGITSFNGLTGATQTLATGSTGSDFNISSSGSAHTFNLPTASSSNRGLLSTTDWSTFNNKQSNTLASGQIWVGNASGGAQARTIAGDATIDNAGAVTVDKTTTATAGKILQLDASSVAATKGVNISGTTSGTVSLRGAAAAGTYTLTLPTSAGSANQVLQTDGTGVLSWISPVTVVNNSAALSNGKIWIGNASNVAAEITVLGAIGYTPINKSGDTMLGDLVTQNISMTTNKYLKLSANATDGTVAGQIWYDSGIIKYFDGTTTKSLGIAGTGITSLNGLTSGAQTFALTTTGTAPGISSSTNTHTFTIPMASTASATGGLISNADYAAFSSKQSNGLAAAKIWVGNASGGAEARSLAGDISTVSNTGSVTVNKTTTGTANTILSLDGTSVGTMAGLALVNTGTVTLSASITSSSYDLKLPAAIPTGNQIMQVDSSGNLSWINTPSFIMPTLSNGMVWIGNSSNGLQPRALSGDATISNVGFLTLKSVGTVGTFSKVVTDAQGRVISGSNILSSDVTTALGYTPVNKTGDTMTGKLNIVESYTSDPGGSPTTSNVTQTAFAGGSSSTDFVASQSSISVDAGSSPMNALSAFSAKAVNNTGITLTSSYGLRTDVINSGSGTTTNGYGVNGSIKNSGTGSIANAVGGAFTATGTAGNMTSAIGVSGSVVTSGTGNVGTAYGGRFDVSTLGGGIATGYGIYIGNVSAGTTKYSLYSADGSTPNYIAGSLGVGVPSPGAKLDVTGSTGLTFRSVNSVTSFAAGNFQNSGSGVGLGLAAGNDAVKISGGHISSTESTNLPTIGTCGSGGSVSGTDIRGTITFGTSISGCTINFGRAYSNNPTCVIGPASDPGSGVRVWVSSTSTTSMTITSSITVSNIKINYFCVD